MKKALFLLLALTMSLQVMQAAQRELVVKLKDGSQRAYHLTSDFHEIVTMKSTATSITLNGDEYAIADVVELRIYEEVPEGAEVIDAIAALPDDAQGRTITLTGFDLSGRRIAKNAMKSGIYIINRKKVVIP